MPIPFRDFLFFPFNKGKGIHTNQLDGEFVKKVEVIGDSLSVTSQQPNNDDKVTRFVGGIQRDLRVIGIALSDTKVFVRDDFSISFDHSDTEVVVPQFTGAKYLAFWYPTVVKEIDYVHVVGDPFNYIQEFENPVSLSSRFGPGFYIATKNTIKPSRSQEKLLAYNFSGQITFIRYFAIRQEADGNDFISSDFTGVASVSSTTSIVKKTYTAGVGNEYDAYAVPENTNDITSILKRGFTSYSNEAFSLYELQSQVIQIGPTNYKVFRTKNARRASTSVDTRIVQSPTL